MIVHENSENQLKIQELKVNITKELNDVKNQILKDHKSNIENLMCQVYILVLMDQVEKLMNGKNLNDQVKKLEIQN